MGRPVIWDELTSPQLGAVAKTTPAVLPIAATEQHGPHLPLATDRLIAEHFMRGLDTALGERVLILPTVAVGCSEHHMDFPGSLTLTHATFAAQVSDILSAVAAHGFTNLVLFNAHGGNLAVGQVVLETFGRRHPDCQVVLMTWWQLAADALLALSDTGPGGVGHACEFETSLMLVAAPQLVQLDALPENGLQPTYPWAEGDMLRRGAAGLYRSFSAMTTNGVVGEPRAASAEKGERITQIVLAKAAEIVASLAEGPGGRE